MFTVDGFVEELECVMMARGIRSEEQVEFILSQLTGSALAEVKHMCGQAKQPNELFTY